MAKELTLEEKKELVEKYKDETISTVWGSALVQGFDKYGEENDVLLLEDGTEKFSLSLDDFVDTIKEYNS